MPWNWNAKPGQSVRVGGGVGTVSEAAETATWPNYEATYLAKRLGHSRPKNAYANRYEAGLEAGRFGDETARQVYLDKITSNYKEEADECLKQEFVQWLQGSHEDNLVPQVYPNRPGQAKRRALGTTYESDGRKVAGEQLNEWKPTRWQKSQLTHLDGVRPFLREKMQEAEEQEFALNVLAEFGPNNIDQAWTYFKHWVKGRPIGPEECIHRDTGLDSVERSTPVHMVPVQTDTADVAVAAQQRDTVKNAARRVRFANTDAEHSNQVKQLEREIRQLVADEAAAAHTVEEVNKGFIRGNLRAFRDASDMRRHANEPSYVPYETPIDEIDVAAAIPASDPADDDPFLSASGLGLQLEPAAVPPAEYEDVADRLLVGAEEEAQLLNHFEGGHAANEPLHKAKPRRPRMTGDPIVSRLEPENELAIFDRDSAELRAMEREQVENRLTEDRARNWHLDNSVNNLYDADNLQALAEAAGSMRNNALHIWTAEWLEDVAGPRRDIHTFLNDGIGNLDREREVLQNARNYRTARRRRARMPGRDLDTNRHQIPTDGYTGQVINNQPRRGRGATRAQRE